MLTTMKKRVSISSLTKFMKEEKNDSERVLLDATRARTRAFARTPMPTTTRKRAAPLRCGCGHQGVCAALDERLLHEALLIAKLTLKLTQLRQLAHLFA